MVHTIYPPLPSADLTTNREVWKFSKLAHAIRVRGGADKQQGSIRELSLKVLLYLFKHSFKLLHGVLSINFDIQEVGS
jgi:hypothetical protein